MKKVVLMMVAAMAMGFASCGNKSANVAPADQTEEATVTETVADDITAELAAQLEAGDAGKLKEVLETAKEKAAQLLKENPEQAKEYLSSVQNYLKENAERVKAVVGDNIAVQTVVTTLTDTPAETIITGLQSQLDAAGNVGQEAVNTAQNAVESAQNAGEQAVETAKQAAQDKVEEAKQKANEKVNQAVDDAKQKANEKMNEAANKALKGLGL